MIANLILAAFVLFDFESPEVRKLHPECVSKNAVGGYWSLCVTNSKPIELKLPFRDLTPYEKIVFDVVTVGSSDTVTLASSFNNAKGGARVRNVPLLCGGYERWEVDLIEWPENMRQNDVDAIRLWIEDATGADEVYVDNVTLTKAGENLPPAPPMFQAMRQKAAGDSAERIAERNRAAHEKAYAAFAADCAAKGQDGASAYLLGEASPMEKILPRGRNAPRALDPKRGLDLALARWEKEAVQLLVAPRKGDLRKVTVAPRGFVGLPLQAIECRVTGYVQTTLPPPYKVFEGTNTVSQPPEVGWWPDPILDYLSSTDVKGRDIQSFWIRVRCPEGQKPGVYRGELVVRADGEKPVAVPFAIRVYDFNVPKLAPYAQACTFAPGPNYQLEPPANLARAKRLSKDPLAPCNCWRKHETEWGDMLADYYITMDSLYHRGDGTKDSPHFGVLKRLKEQGRLGWFNLGYWSEPKDLSEASKKEWREETLGRLAACYRRAKELGLLDRAYVYGCDEAAVEKFPQITWAIDELKRAFPGVPVFTTAYDNEFGVGTALKGIDWFTPLTPEYRPAKAAAARREGRQVWWYVCCGPGNPYANMFIESPALEGRSLMGMQAVKYRPDGFLYYQLTLWNSERPISGDYAFTDWMARSWTKINGDGSWTCCGPDGTPLATQRLENYRDGIEDYAYAMELEKRMKAHPGHPCEAKAKELLEVRAVRSLEDFSREPRVIEAWRRALAETIEAYGIGPVGASVLSDGWEFRREGGAWEKVRVPHDWAIKGPFDKRHDLQVVAIAENNEKQAEEKTGRTGALPWIGRGEYRRTVEIPAGTGFAALVFDGAMSEPEVFCDGAKVGEWKHGYNAFEVSLPVKPGRHEILVKLNNRPESSRWYPGAGLIRPVKLVLGGKDGIATWGNAIWTPDLKTVRVKTECRGRISRLVYRILDGARKLAVSESGTLTGAFEPWSPENPKLYTLVTEAYDAQGALVERRTDRFGVRTVEFGKKGFLLNGRARKFNGVCMHHDLGPLGAAFDADAFRRQMTLLKEMGCDSLRTSHNMPAEGQLEVCDELGILVMAESFDSWAGQKVANGYNLFFNDWWRRDVENLVKKGRSHPSVVMWSIGNEIEEQGESSGVATIRAMQSFIHTLDPDPARKVTQGLSWMPHAINSGWNAAMEIPAVTYRLPFYEAMYTNSAAGFVLGGETASTLSTRGHYHFPVKVLYDTPFPDLQCSSYDVEYCNWSNLPDDDWAMQEDKPWTIGEFVWTGFDYLGEPWPYDSEWPSRSAYFGIFDLAGLPKDRYWLYRSHWNKTSHTLHLVPHWTFPDRVGKVTPVYCYTDFDEAELFVNGKSQGRRRKDKSSRLDRFRLRWNDVVYAPGELKVVAYGGDGKSAMTETVRTAGAPAKVELTKRRFGNLLFVTASIVDAKGTLVPDASDTLAFTCGRDLRFKGICNGDPTSLESFVVPRMKAFHGQLVAVFEGPGDEVTVTR